MSVRQSSLVGDIGRLLLSGGVAQGIALLLVVFIGRQYDQEAMGVQGLMLSWSGILTTIVMGRYEQTIVIARTDERAERLWQMCLSLAVIGSAIIAALAGAVYLLWEANPLGGFIHWIAPYVLTTATANATMMLLLRHKAYTRLGIAQGLRTISNNLIKVLLGLRYPTALSLVVSTCAASVIGSIPLVRYLRQASPLCWTKLDLRYLRHYIAFPLYSSPQALVNTLTGSLLVVLLPLGYGLKEVGLMTMIMMLVRRPLLVLSDSVGQVYFERMSRAFGSGSSPLDLIRRLIRTTLALGIPACVLVYLLVEEAVPLLLGDGWEALAHIIVCMLPYLLVNFLASILNVLPDILGRQRADLIFRLVRLAVECTAIFVGMRLLAFDSFVAYYYLFLFALELVYVLFLLRLVRPLP